MVKFSTKVIAVILSLSTLILLCSCGQSREFAIEKHNWTFKYAQNSDGEVVYCNAENKDLYKDAKVVDLRNSAKGGVFMISDNDTQKTFAFHYELREEDETSLVYDTVYVLKKHVTDEQAPDWEAKGCLATVSKTTDENGNGEYSLVISVEGYSIYFYESIK